MRYNVLFTFGGCISVEAESIEDAEALVEEKDDEELLPLCLSGFAVQAIEEE